MTDMSGIGIGNVEWNVLGAAEVVNADMLIPLHRPRLRIPPARRLHDRRHTYGIRICANAVDIYHLNGTTLMDNWVIGE